MITAALSLTFAPERIPGITGSLPTSSKVTFAIPKNWNIEPVSEKRVEDFNQWRGVVNGKMVTIKPTTNWPTIDFVKRGRDGSLHIGRASRQIHWASQSSIFWKGVETVVPGDINVYRDRNNYLASTTEYQAGGMPITAPSAYLVQNGKKSMLGPGRGVAWEPNGMIVLSVPVDDVNLPSGYEFTTGSVTRIVGWKDPIAIRNFSFLGWQKDGSALLGTGDGHEYSSNGYLYFGESSHDAEVISVKDSIVNKRWRLPASWRIIGASKQGWLLVRKLPIRREPQPFGTGDEFFKQMDKYSEQVEKDKTVWHVGRMENGVITPIKFSRPKGSETLSWSDTTIGIDAFRIHTRGENGNRSYRISIP